MAKAWVIYADDSFLKKYKGAGVVLITPDGEKLCSSLKLEFKTINNEIEYEAVIARLDLALKIGAKVVELQSDS